jgi:hypothetical protein
VVKCGCSLHDPTLDWPSALTGTDPGLLTRS